MRMRYAFLSIICLASALTSGCVSRELYITSEPTGAEVTINDTYRGKTPMTHKFIHYGTYGIRLEMQDHHPLYVEEKVTPPLYEKPGLDLISEAFIPKKMHDRREFHYKMEKIEDDVNIDELMQRATNMRDKMAGVAKAAELQEQDRKPLKLPLPVRERVREAEEDAAEEAEKSANTAPAPEK